MKRRATRPVGVHDGLSHHLTIDHGSNGRLAWAWAESGALHLTGRPNAAPLGPPAPLISGLWTLANELASVTDALDRQLVVDPLAMLTWRAAIAGLQRGGDRSCGGATHMLATRDGWVALSLPRHDDIDLVPAWLELTTPLPRDPWPTVAATVRHRGGEELRDRGAMLGMALALVGERTGVPTPDDDTFVGLPVTTTTVGPATPQRFCLDGVRVLDLSSLWAGPWCGELLARAGADVVKVESERRPDGARSGPPQFFDLLNATKRSVALDFDTSAGRSMLRRLIGAADVIIEASRPRALQQLGIDAIELLERPDEGPQAWLSITGHGRLGASGHRIGFGDDAAAAGGLVAIDGDGPVFLR